MKYKIVWSTEHASGELPGEYETEKDAQDASENWMIEMGDGHESEVIELEDEEESEESFNPKQMGWVDQFGCP